MIDDFDAVLAPPDHDADDEERSRMQSSPNPEEAADVGSEFRSYLDDPA